MRLIVGPLPAAVYWRRRAMVLGALLVAVLMITLAVRGTGSGGAQQPSANGMSTGAGVSPVSAQPAPTAAASPSDGIITPVSELPPSPSADVAGEGEGDGETDPNACTDSEIKVTAKPAQATLKRGADLLITLLIKNTSNRTCTRDVGADLQELRILKGTEKVWSSDDCGGPRGHEVRSFPPAHERSYTVVWNGHASSACEKSIKRVPDGPVPAAGEYRLYARVGTAISGSVTLKLT
ncbi:hypothetical protein Cme02nite_27310 [Catellatospora methionotrophica]|uniref:Uncharacterized protein n=1 Tax=Catellatospora methionotrophica TaxID=121620 RepID=A0A8J3L9V3_9ACTN|nr:hypothetical protein [Catellatospora methionotrophica]GIG14399.1 hypothetical protein Cme02nite_27310 [Catellatospora methionotrophica]